MPPPPASRRLALPCFFLVIVLLSISTLTLHPRASSHVQRILWHSASTTSAQSTFLSDPSKSLSYRDRLERQGRERAGQEWPNKGAQLGFDKIYVLSLPGRKDRRGQMSKLARALGVQVTFVDASLKDEPWVKWVAERVLEVRRQRVQIMAQERHIDIGQIGGLHVGNDWLAQSPSWMNTTSTPAIFPSSPNTTHPTPSEGQSWVDVLEAHHSSGSLRLLQPDDPELNITAALWDPLEAIDGRQVNEGVISTFFGHTRVMKRMIEDGAREALVMEDDVDVEWDIERMWERVRRRLPREAGYAAVTEEKSWDVAFLGHCWAKELMTPQHLHPLLHRSNTPLCLHGYALSFTGAQTLLSLLNNPWTAYSTAVDTAVPSYLHMNITSTGSYSSSGRLLEGWSIDPPLIIQRKDGPSDIQQGVGSIWRGLLMDSTVERIKRADGEWTAEEDHESTVWDDNRVKDPGTVYRLGGTLCHA